MQQLDRNTLENFKVTFELETPFIMDRYTTLDSMLIAEYFKIVRRKNKHMEYSDDLSMIDFIAKENGVFSGSIWYIPKDNPLKLDFTSFYKKPEPKKIFDITDKFAKKPVSNDFLSSTAKAFAMSEEIIVTPEIYFYIRADKKRLIALLQNIKGIGKKRNIGFGKVSSFIIEAMDEDKSIILNKTTPAKPVPVDSFAVDSKKIAFHRAIPPYWSNKDLVACYMPSTALIEYTDNSSKNKKFKVLDDLSFESGLGYVARLLSGKLGLPKIEGIKLEEDKTKQRWEVINDNREKGMRCCISDEVDKKGIQGVGSYVNTKLRTFTTTYLINNSNFISQTALWGMTLPVLKLTGDSLVQNKQIKKLTQAGSEEGFRFKDYIKNPYMLKPPFVIMRKVSSSKPEHVLLSSKKALSNALYPIQYADKTHYIDSELLLKAVKDVRDILKSDKKITKSHLLGLWRDKKHPELGKNNTKENQLIVENFQKLYDKTIRMSLFSVTDFS
ncbi:hypothetical protein [Sulfurimonas indica]|uniref:hypothetical protein n=1 Tax=Sulfurimonas TaxID=202746 RepID=UPI001264FDA5|nr:hypothetical protein [Sulfurimonas indica]